MIRPAIVFGLTLGAFLVARRLDAHEYWVEPKPFAATRDQPIALSLKVGDGADIEEKKFDPQHAREFFATDGTQMLAITSAEGALPAGSVALPRSGTWAVVYWSRNKSIELEPKKFEEYLREDGLEPILAARQQLGESEKPAREVYMRCAKALVRVSGAASNTSGAESASNVATSAIGMPLEIVADIDPTTAPDKSVLRFKLLYSGKSLESALVKIVNLAEPTKEITTRTSKDGGFEFTPTAGEWRVSAVHMIRAENEPNAEWQSYWASLTFRSGGTQDREDPRSSSEPGTKKQSD